MDINELIRRIELADSAADRLAINTALKSLSSEHDLFLVLERTMPSTLIARGVVRRIVDLAGDFDSAAGYLALAYEHEGDYETAVAIVGTEPNTINPVMLDAWIGLSIDDAEMHSRVLTAIKRHGEHPRFYRRLASVGNNAGDMKLLLEALDWLAENDSTPAARAMAREHLDRLRA
jgi:hypothetical protein